MNRSSVIRHRLGAQPGPYVVTAVVIAAVALPFRLWLDRGDPLPRIIALSALTGATYALVFFVVDAVARRRRRDDPADRPGAAAVRQGSLVGLVAGVPYFGGLVAMCLATDRVPLYPISFGLVLIAVVALAVRNLRRAR